MTDPTDKSPPTTMPPGSPPGRAFEHIARAEALDANGIFAAMAAICATDKPRDAADALMLIAPKATQSAINLHNACAQTATNPAPRPSSGCT